MKQGGVPSGRVRPKLLERWQRLLSTMDAKTRKELARLAGVTNTTLFYVVNEDTLSVRVEAALREAMGTFGARLKLKDGKLVLKPKTLKKL